jgi:dephospho-CoA kinase
MIRVGLTGGIGSGKTTVAQIFEVLGIPVYYADDAAKRLMNTDTELISKIKNAFGETVYKNNSLDRQYLASIVFNDNYKLELLNSFVHPATIADAERWVQQQTTPYIIKEAALLFESGAAEHLDHIIGINAAINIRIKRVMDRDGVSQEEVVKRINNQMDENIKMKLCDFIINNDEQQLLIPQVLNLHQRLLKLAEK